MPDFTTEPRGALVRNQISLAKCVTLIVWFSTITVTKCYNYSTIIMIINDNNSITAISTWHMCEFVPVDVKLVMLKIILEMLVSVSVLPATWIRKVKSSVTNALWAMQAPSVKGMKTEHHTSCSQPNFFVSDQKCTCVCV